MRREAITLVFAMGIGSVLMAASKEQALLSAAAKQAGEGAAVPVGQKDPAQRKDLREKINRLEAVQFVSDGATGTTSSR